MYLVCAFLLTMAAMLSASADDKKALPNINVIMMESTGKILSGASVGTGFVLIKPSSTNSGLGFYTLITAHHVLEGMGNEATFLLRRTTASNAWEKVSINLTLRKDGKATWKKHPDLDLAAIHIGLPNGCIRYPISTALLLEDKSIEKFELGPGTELLCLGYPLGQESNAIGFPILRSGKIASYPILPTKQFKTFSFDFTVFGGNSGGPVYLFDSTPTYGGALHVGSIQGIVGLVTAQRISPQISQSYNKSTLEQVPLVLGEVIHAHFIREVVDSLPEPK